MTLIYHTILHFKLNINKIGLCSKLRIMSHFLRIEIIASLCAIWRVKQGNPEIRLHFSKDFIELFDYINNILLNVG